MTQKVDIKTRDGTCPAYVFTPDGKGPWPGVLMYMDGIGIRPALLEVGAELASHGYYVLLPDLYYRSGPYEPMDAKRVFTDPDQLQMLRTKYMATATLPNFMSDTESFLGFLSKQKDVRPGGIGTTGYCMGGAPSLAAAGTFPDRILASAAYHPSRTMTDAPESPEQLAPRIKARVYVGAAMEDASFPEEKKAQFQHALTGAGVDFTFETYPAKHGFVFRDTLTFDADARERHWKTLTTLFSETLSGAPRRKQS